MNFGEKLLVKKVYTNAFTYVATHLKGFLFLTLFYYLISLIPITNTYLHLISLYLLLYFAAGLYYKQRILVDKHIFIHATLRFITAIMMFIISMIVSSLAINFVIHIICAGHTDCNISFNQYMKTNLGLTVKYVFLFFLMVAFFLIPSFTFISEISGKSRSVINAYVKTKGNIHKISIISVIAITLTWLCMAIFAFVNPYIAQFAYTAALTFGIIVYFKMYDFFYSIPKTQHNTKPKIKETKTTTIKNKKLEENK